MVSMYPPARDGIARYAAQVVNSLRKQGDSVVILSPEPSAAEHHARLSTYRGMALALKLARAADRTIVEFVPGLFFTREGMASKLRLWPALMTFLGAGNVELVVHEAPYREVASARGPRRALARVFWRSVFSRPERTFVHTGFERDQMVAAMGLDPGRVNLLDHGRFFHPRTAADQKQARADLGIAADEFVFICIGFLQSHKGFDRAVRAMGRLGPGRVRLDVVGATRTNEPTIEAYAADLRDLVAATPRTYLHRGFVSDEIFDRWIIASDVVVLPYRDIWSSGVLERAKLLGRPAIVTAVGGLPDQAGSDTQIARDDDELAAIMARTGGVDLVQDILTELADDPETTPRDRAQMKVQGRAGAARAKAGGLPPPPASARPLMHGSPEIRPIFLPTPDSGGWLRSRAKRLVYRTVRWLLGPLVAQLNDRLARLAESQSELERRLAAHPETADDPTAPIDHSQQP